MTDTEKELDWTDSGAADVDDGVGSFDPIDQDAVDTEEAQLAGAADVDGIEGAEQEPAP